MKTLKEWDDHLKDNDRSYGDDGETLKLAVEQVIRDYRCINNNDKYIEIQLFKIFGDPKSKK